MRRARVAVVWVVAGLVGAGLVPGTAQGDVVPAISVTPSTGLVSGQQVVVDGTGFPPGGTGVLECRTGVAGIDDCDLGTLHYLETAPDGTFSVQYSARRVIRVGGALLDCVLPDACVVAAGNLVDQTTGASAPIAFDPTAPLPSPTVTVEPSTGLVGGQQVTVTGSGFRPASYLFVSQCLASVPFCSPGPGGYVEVDAGGGFSVVHTIRTRVAGPDGTTSCIPDACVLDVTDWQDPLYSVRVPLALDPDQPPPPALTLLVSPSTALADRQEVGVLGTGFEPDQYVSLSECTASTALGCGGSGGAAQTNAEGAFLVGLQVRRSVVAYGPDGPTLEDCAVVSCVLVANQYESSLIALAPLAFDPALPPAPPPTITVEPNENLGYRQAVTVHGSGFSPGAWVPVEQCAGDPSEPYPQPCRGFGGTFADAAGELTTTLTVRRTITGFGPLPEPESVDCAAPETPCFVVASRYDLLDRAVAQITFDPNAPIPPPPTFAVSPDAGLAFRQLVDVVGSGFDPGEVVYLTECKVDAAQPYGYPCAGFDEAEADPDGNLADEVTVRRMLADGFAGTAFDCASAPGACELRVQRDDGEEIISVPLAFDPDAPVPPPPTLTLTPDVGLADGQTVELDGSGFTPDANIGYALCRAGALSVNDCDLSKVGYATSTAEGQVHGEIVAAETIHVGFQQIDCGAVPGACVVGIANINDYLEHAFAPVSFGPIASIADLKVRETTGVDRIVGAKVSLSRPSTREVRVRWETRDGSATSPDDYFGASGEVVFAPGETEQQVPLGIMGDDRHERCERFAVELSDPHGTSLTAHGSRGRVVIVDDDHPGRRHHRSHHRHRHHGCGPAHPHEPGPTPTTVVP